MAFVKIKKGVVVAKDISERKGFIEVSEEIVCGMFHNGGKIYDNKSFSAPVISKTWKKVRDERAFKLLSCDWTQLDDCPLSAELKSDWAEYRQDLRDITDAYDTPDDVVWPVAP